MSIRISSTLFRSFPDGLRLAVNPLPERTPGIAWLGSVFAPLGTFSVNPAHGVLLLTLLLSHTNLMLLSILIERNGYSRLVNLTVLGFIASGSLFVGIGQTFFSEPLLLTGVLLTLIVTIGPPPTKIIELLPHQAVAMLLAVLGKLMAPVYLVLPVSYILFSHTRAPNPLKCLKRLARQRDTRAVIFLYALFSLWLITASHGLITRAMFSTKGPIASFYGSHSGFLEKLIYWGGQVVYSYTTSYCFVFLMLVFVIYFFMLVSSPLSLTHYHQQLLLVSSLQIMFSLALFSLADNEDTRFLYALSPYLALILASLLAGVPLWLQRCFFLVVIFQFVSLWSYLFSFPTIQFSYNRYSLPLRTDRVALAEIRSLIGATCPRQLNSYANIVGVDLPNLNHNTLNSYASLLMWPNLPTCSYTSLGYMETNADTAYNRLMNFRPLHVIFPVQLPVSLTHDPLNMVTSAVLARLKLDPGYRELTGAPSAYAIWTLAK